MAAELGGPMKFARSLAAAVIAAMLFAGAGLAQQQKVIKDAAEYNAYIAALNIADPAKKAAAMEEFIQKYPASVVKLDALGQAMAAWQQAGNTAAVESDAERILALDKGNVRALAVLTALERAAVTQGKHEAMAALKVHAAEGLRALPKFARPEGMSDADFARLKNQLGAVLEGGAGFVALQEKDYAAARARYLAAVKLDPGGLQDLYQLGIAELSLEPPDATGFWHIAKAESLARAQNNAAGAQSIDAYGKARYKRYHGSEQGWDAILAAAPKQAAPPAGFAHGISSPAAELAVKAVAENDPASLSFSDMEYVLSWRDASPANKAAAEKVWQAIEQLQKKNARLKLPAKLVAATKDSVLAAIIEENQQANKADLHARLAKQPPHLPAPGSSLFLIGRIDGYRLNPFQFQMKDAELAEK